MTLKPDTNSGSEADILIPKGYWPAFQMVLANQTLIMNALAIVLESNGVGYPQYAQVVKDQAKATAEIIKVTK